MTKISNIIGREILDSRGYPTVEVDVILEDGSVGRASVPSGSSKGAREALELRDNDYRYHGMGVLKAVNNINGEIRDNLIGMEAFDQESIDKVMIKLDGTENKSRLGANAIAGVSMAVLRAAACSINVPLYQYISDLKAMPTFLMNILNGGVHASNNLDIQEFMIVPKANSVGEMIRIGSEVFHSLEEILNARGLSTSVGLEGGFAPDLSSSSEAFELIISAISSAGYKPGEDVCLAIDVAASSLYYDQKYHLDGKEFSSVSLIDYYESFCNKYPIISIEDGMDQNDWNGFKLLTRRLGNKVQLVGDDLFVTNTEYLKKGIDMGCCNAILIKINQIGTVTEMFDTIRMAKSNGYNTIISHRSGETEDTTICDIAVALGASQVKFGSLSRTDRLCKYNQLIRIEENISMQL